ncbi:MAG: hypothetical protein J5965_29365 [Aeriscardovia sp.]|nr:hypothetical protein [Aeriscardovia sp.]MBO6143802.1 hypothetical protein [Prevotella sp.]
MYNRIKDYLVKHPLGAIIPLLIVFIIVAKHYIEESNPPGTSWDYLAFPISCVALFYAIRSYSIAKETLLSQQQTQKNTLRFSDESQALVLSKIATQLIDNFCRLSAINRFFKSTKGKGFPLPRLFNEMYVEQQSIHLELAYKDANYFLNLSLIQQALVRYNKSLKSTQHIFEVLSFNESAINNEMSVLLEQTISIFCNICDLFKKEGSLNINKMKRPLIQFIEERSKQSIPIDNDMSIIENLLFLINGSKDSEIYRSVIIDNRIYYSLNNEIERFGDSIKDSLILKIGENSYKFLLWEQFPEQELNQDNFVRVLGFIAYLYYKKELKDIILLSNEKKDL